MQLILPSLKYKKEYIEALEESKQETGETRLDQSQRDESFESYVKRLSDNAKGLNLLRGHVPSTMFWLIDEGQLIGRVQIRHKLNSFLYKTHGHIGYYIRPSKRKLGYGKKILYLALSKAKKIGLSKILITCDSSNIASSKIIEANGGISENPPGKEKVKLEKRRYWISI